MSYEATAWAKHCPVESLQGSYDALGWSGPGLYRQALADAVAEALHEVYVRKNRAASLLDVACFTGEYYGQLRGLQFPVSYTGVDVTPAYVEAARKRWGSEPCKFEVASAFDLGKREADVVLCAGLLIHVDDPLAVLRECARVAKEWLVLGVSVNLQGDKEVIVSETEPFIVRRYHPGYVTDLIREVGGTIQNPPTAVYPDCGEGVWVVRL